MSRTSARSALALIASMTLIALLAAPASAAPTASFDVSANPTSGVPVTFTSTSTTPDLFPIASTQWNINGAVATEASVAHTFATAGTYTVSLTVTNTELVMNTDTETKMITVATRPPTAEFSFNPASPAVGDNILFASNATDPDNESLSHSWDFGDGSGPSTARNPTHAYTTPGTKTVRLTVSDGHPGGADDITHTVVVRDPSAAKASFTFAPTAPLTGQSVTFTSTSTPSAGQTISSLNWDLDSDGQYDDGQGKTVTRAFDSAGVYRVALRVVQANGNPAVAEGTVRVGAIVATPLPGGGSTPTPPSSPGTTPKAKPTLLSPFPIVRLLTLAYVDRTVVNALSIQAPRRALVRVRCLGKHKGCPKLTRRKRSKGRPLRFKTFERSFKVGAKLQIFVVAKGHIGKYTGFKIRRGKPPARTDLCVLPGKSKPRPCPS